MYCEFCEKNYSTGNACPNCGKTIYTADGRIIYGPTADDSCDCETTITEKYLIIRRVSKSERRGDTWSRGAGLIGAIINEAAKSGKDRDFGFYSLNQIAKGIFPYRTNKIKKKNAIKLINKDGTEFILIFDKPGMMDGTAKVLRKMVEYISASIPVVEDGTYKTFGSVHCAKPFVNYDNFDKILPAKTSEPAPAPKPEPEVVITPPPAPQVVVTPPAQPVKVEPAPVVVPKPVVEPTPVVEPEPVVTPDPVVTPEPADESEKLVCASCGHHVALDSNFCNMCGSKIERIKKCVTCGKVLDDIDRFCSNCGTAVQQ